MKPVLISSPNKDTIKGVSWRYATERTPALILTHSLSGSGKSTHTAQLVELLGAIRLRSDVERKRLFGLAPTEKTYAHQAQQARLLTQPA